MRGLNLLRTKHPGSGKSRWQCHQQQQISLFVKGYSNGDAARPAFPGSMLFNQILIPLSDPDQYRSVQACMADSVDYVYQYCSDVRRDNSLSDFVIIDVGDNCESAVTDVIAAIIKPISSIKRIVFLGQSAHAAMAKPLGSYFEDKLAISVIEPDWDSGYELHKLYRQAEYVVFVNTMRVLDAAYTGCDCSLVSSDNFRANKVFDLLVRQLKSVDCPVFDHLGASLQPEAADVKRDFLLVENRQSDLEHALNNTHTLREERDWLCVLAQGNTSPVIVENHGSFRDVIVVLSDYKTRLKRKTNKLRDDPLAFLLDSNHKALNHLGDFLRKRRAG